jgi:hypothetical protein
MKVTKSYLKQVIKEELGRMEEMADRPAVADPIDSKIDVIIQTLQDPCIRETAKNDPKIARMLLMLKEKLYALQGQKLKEGGVAIGSRDDALAQMGYDKKGPEFASQTGMLKAVADYTITQIVKALGALRKGESERVENILEDTVEYLDTKLTGLEPNRMSPKMDYK